jgi:hypothetical protein
VIVVVVVVERLYLSAIFLECWKPNSETVQVLVGVPHTKAKVFHAKVEEVLFRADID